LILQEIVSGEILLNLYGPGVGWHHI